MTQNNKINKIITVNRKKKQREIDSFLKINLKIIKKKDKSWKLIKRTPIALEKKAAIFFEIY